jgi:hypothetical protein
MMLSSMLVVFGKSTPSASAVGDILDDRGHLSLHDEDDGIRIG